MRPPRRSLWWADNIASRISEDSLAKALWKYRLFRDREEVDGRARFANLVSSRTQYGTHLPILDLDFPHRYVRSSTLGHGHLYLDVEIPRWRWVALMIGLRLGGVIEHGTFVWSLRRMGNFVRVEGMVKRPSEYSTIPEPVPDYLGRREVD